MKKKKSITFTLASLLVLLFLYFELPVDISGPGGTTKIWGAMTGLSGKYTDIRNYNNIRIIVESDRRQYSVGHPIPIKLSVINKSGKTFIFNTGKICDENGVLSKKKWPVYDIIFVGYVVEEAGKKDDYLWSWSQNFQDPIITKIALAPHEKKVLIEFVWKQPKVRYIQGGFKIRFADFEYPTGIRIKPPER